MNRPYILSLFIFQRFHLFLHLFQIFTDGQALGTDFFAFSTGFALIGPLCFRQILEIILSGDLLISVHGKVVPDPEVLRNINAMRAGHTVSASRTAILRSGLDGSGNSLHNFLFLLSQRLKIAESFQVVLHLLHRGHTA